jgi:hemoglobin-like flavoprotein
MLIDPEKIPEIDVIRELNEWSMDEMQPRALTKNQVGLLKITFRSLNTQRLGQRFYEKLFNRHPQLKPMFTTNLDEQIAKIISVLELVVFSFEERKADEYTLQESVVLPLRDLGKKHEQKGVENMHYPIANQILLEAIKDEARDVLTSEGLEAWKLALDHLTFAMLNPSVVTSSGTRTLKESFGFIKRMLKRV